MKMTEADFAELRDLMEPLDLEAYRHMYREGKFPRAESVKELDMRYRWDLFWAIPSGDDLRRRLFDYLWDSHIDTALRRIVPPLREKETETA